MKIIITSGGTTEAIDSVRGITNHATGELGKKIAQQFLNQGHQVTLVTTKNSHRPKPNDRLTIKEIKNVADLISCLEPLVKTHDLIIHSMAVSDYTPVYMTNLEEVEKAEQVHHLLEKQNTETKISSDSDYQVLFLKKTPKVISLIKSWNPAIHLIGFKLLVDVSREHLIDIARQSLKKNQADYILANDLKDIHSGQHQAYLINENSIFQAETKDQIAQLILEKTSHFGKESQ